MDVSINIISEDILIKKRIEAEKANIFLNNWDIKNLKIFNFDKTGNVEIENKDHIEFISFYNVEKLNSLFKNLDTISFIELLTKSENLIIRGYEKKVRQKRSLFSLILYFFLALMTLLAAIFTINNRNSNNINYLMIAVLTCAVIYYMKDLSVALGKSDRISPEISVWIPIIIISLINSIGLLQINEK